MRQLILSTVIFVLLLVAVIYLFHHYQQPAEQDAALLACRNDKPVTSLPKISIHFVKAGKQALVSIVLINGWRSQYEKAVPVLQKADFPAVVAMSLKDLCHRDTLSWQQLRQLQSQGYEIASMGKSLSCNISGLSTQTLQEELAQSKQLLKIHGLLAQTFIMPCGYGHFVHPALLAALKTYYQKSIDLYGEVNHFGFYNPYETYAFYVSDKVSKTQIESWMKRTKKTKGWLVLVFNKINEPMLKQLKNTVSLINKYKLEVILPRQINLESDYNATAVGLYQPNLHLLSPQKSM